VPWPSTAAPGDSADASATSGTRSIGTTATSLGNTGRGTLSHCAWYSLITCDSAASAARASASSAPKLILFEPILFRRFCALSHAFFAALNRDCACARRLSTSASLASSAFILLIFCSAWACGSHSTPHRFSPGRVCSSFAFCTS
jgi:hypothetical protein